MKSNINQRKSYYRKQIYKKDLNVFIDELSLNDLNLFISNSIKSNKKYSEQISNNGYIHTEYFYLLNDENIKNYLNDIIVNQKTILSHIENLILKNGYLKRYKKAKTKTKNTIKSYKNILNLFINKKDNNTFFNLLLSLYSGLNKKEVV